jgi:hypothetical protein
MGQIYAQSALTIIAVARDNPDHGLPGVSSTPRKIYPSMRTGNLNLVALPIPIQREVSKTVWSSRGWTYQESLLARRRLLFTESQVYFQYAGMHRQESLSIPLKSLHVKDLSKFDDKHKGHFPRSGIGKTAQEIFIRIQEYVMRGFTYASDALNAFQGVLGAFQLLENPVHHFCGIMILSPSTFKSTKLLTIGQIFAFGLG